MDTQDMLSSILNDPEKMKSIMSIASSFTGQKPGAGATPFSPSQPDVSPASAPPPPEPSSAAFSGNASSYDPSAELLSKALPVITAIAQSGKNAINHDKMNLLLSLKPFVTNDVGNQMEHAIRLLSMARMAKTAMGQIGNITASDGKMEL